MDLFSDENDIFSAESMQNKLARESLEEYAEQHFGFATPKEKEFKNQLDNPEFFNQAHESLISVSNLIYSAAMLSRSSEDIYKENEKRFLSQCLFVSDSLFEMRVFMLEQYKDLLIEENFNLENNQVYNERIINLIKIIKKIKI